jgi:hypothetical protein
LDFRILGTFLPLNNHDKAGIMIHLVPLGHPIQVLLPNHRSRHNWDSYLAIAIYIPESENIWHWLGPYTPENVQAFHQSNYHSWLIHSIANNNDVIIMLIYKIAYTLLESTADSCLNTMRYLPNHVM